MSGVKDRGQESCTEPPPPPLQACWVCEYSTETLRWGCEQQSAHRDSLVARLGGKTPARSHAHSLCPGSRRRHIAMTAMPVCVCFRTARATNRGFTSKIKKRKAQPLLREMWRGLHAPVRMSRVLAQQVGAKASKIKRHHTSPLLAWTCPESGQPTSKFHQG